MEQFRSEMAEQRMREEMAQNTYSPEINTKSQQLAYNKA